MTDRILEIGSAGLESTDQRVRKLMDNMVNAEVPGYKKSEAVIRGFPLELESASQRLGPVRPQVESSIYNNQPGALVKTGGKLDVALGSDGLFVISGPWGDGYTRDGRFQLDKDGRIITVAGNYPVLGQSGPLVVTPGADVEITQDGAVRIDQVVVDKLRVVNPEQPGALTPLNGSIFKRSEAASGLQEVENPRVIQGYVESSNVNVVDQMMEMIMVERTYNVNAKIISTRDASLARAMDLGRPTQ